MAIAGYTMTTDRQFASGEARAGRYRNVSVKR
jgi:hypothetical protein